MSDALPLSLVVITRNAGRELAACLASASFAADMVVVDSGSEDDTVQIARSFNARVIELPWSGFGPQKNAAVKAAAHDWVLCLDADETLSPELRQSIIVELRSPKYRLYVMARRNRFLGRWLRHGEGYPDWNARLFDRREASWSRDLVHEHVVYSGEKGRLRGDLLHTSAESLHEYLCKQNRYTSLQAQAMFDRGERSSVMRMVLSPIVRFLRFYVWKAGFLDGAAGFVHIMIGCYNSLLKYAKLRALEITPRP